MKFQATKGTKITKVRDHKFETLSLIATGDSVGRGIERVDPAKEPGRCSHAQGSRPAAVTHESLSAALSICTHRFGPPVP